MIPRDVTIIVNWVLDQLLPPVLRDQRWLMGLLMRPVLGRQYIRYLDFREKLHLLDDAALGRLYVELADTFIKRPTDLNRSSLAWILEQATGPLVLDAGCGRGFLLEALRQRHPGWNVCGVDVAANTGQAAKGSVLALPFADHSFDTVVCAHTLEHVRDFHQALRELRRVSARRLLIVVPSQREYRHSFDLHIHFFPYLHVLRRMIGEPGATFLRLGGDLACCLDRP